MTIIQLIVFTSIALGLQHLLYMSGAVRAEYSWYRRIRYDSRGWELWRNLLILWIALVLSTEITYIVGLRLYG